MNKIRLLDIIEISGIFLIIILFTVFIITEKPYTGDSTVDPCREIIDSLYQVIDKNIQFADSVLYQRQLIEYKYDSLAIVYKQIKIEYEKVVNNMVTWSNDQHAVYFSTQTNVHK